jgi:hypothetical protein
MMEVCKKDFCTHEAVQLFSIRDYGKWWPQGRLLYAETIVSVSFFAAAIITVNYGTKK